MAISYSTTDYESFSGSGPYVDIKNFISAGGGKLYVQNISATGTENYATGGFAAKFKKLGVKKVIFVLIGQNNSSYGTEYVASTDKIKLFTTGVNSELGANTSISGLKLQVLIIGKNTK